MTPREIQIKTGFHRQGFVFHSVTDACIIFTDNQVPPNNAKYVLWA